MRPVLVIQNDRDNQRLLNTIVVQITSLTRRALEPTQLLIELATPAGRQSGLRQDSVMNCVNLLTLDKDDPAEPGKLARFRHSASQHVS